MPFFNAAQRAECMTETMDAIAMLENIIEHHPHHHIIIGGDFNTEMKGDSPFDPLWDDFSNKYNLSSCDQYFPNSTVTYKHNSLDHKKWSDHFLVSASLCNEGRLSDHKVIDEGDNLSDHFPILMSLSTKIQNREVPSDLPISKPKLKWDKISNGDKSNYTAQLHSLVSSTPPNENLTRCQNTCRCRNSECHEAIQEEYNCLVNLCKIADGILPRFKPGVEKDWWTDALSCLKQKSIEIQRLWISQGRPGQGPIHDERLRVRAAYKCAIRAAQRAPKQNAWDRLHSSLADCDTNSFWKSWRKLYNKNNCHLAPVVNGCSTKKDIADSFMDNFRQNSTPNNRERVESLNERFSEKYSAYIANHNESCDCKTTYVSIYDLIDALNNMKMGKCADEDEISAEHLHFAPVNMLSRLTALFNSMLRHSYVPKQFQRGFMVPLVKDHQGNLSDTNNYRGITISPIISKLFEHVLKTTFSDHLSTSEYQFGFKKHSSTSHAVHCLRETVNYYINNGSRVFCTFLDASKAFDRLIHSGLFMKLIDRKVPLVFLDIIINWYSDLQCRVKWGDQFSDWFCVTAGVRQGGVLSPDFYSIYVNDLLHCLIKMGIRCYYLRKFAAALFYANDMAILSPSLKGLDLLLKACGEYCLEWDICLNAKKSRNLYFGKKTTISHPILLNGVKIEWAEQWVYLGVTLKSAKRFDCSIVDRVKKFYRCTNAIFRIDGHSNDMVMLRLAETHCVPILTYAIEVIDVANRDELRQLRVAYNSLFRKIFKYRWNESVTALQHFLKRPTWEELADKRRMNFVQRIHKSGFDTLSRLFICSPYV